MTTEINNVRKALDRLIHERCYTVTLLTLLTADITTRRELEGARGVQFPERKSISVEKTRQNEQEELRRIDQEIDSMIDLIIELTKKGGVK